MKKTILSAIAAMAIFLTSFGASPVKPPDCGCGGPNVKTVNTPDSLLSHKEKKVKSILLSLKGIDVSKLVFTEETIPICSSWYLWGIPPYPNPGAYEYNQATALKAALHASGYSCVCRKRSTEGRGTGGGSWEERWCTTVTIITNTACTCIDEAD